MDGTLAWPLVVLLIVVFMVERLWRWARGVHKSDRSASAAGLEELTAMFYGSKRLEQEQREIDYMLRDDEYDGAPPTNSVDLDAGVARIHRQHRTE
ncbi:hypothetical protein HUT06_07010 [Actinomadura sp. NAK00032]|uniref:DUF6191 domain-containing protein n=1 Tax=Actinomadura sp. NAK00032 TaxID=2742128 RepID=UPI00158FEFF5|nr:DUF6191 domain-containing protein [Actinomadura sp. NAK00032]QKW33813.1 hypothetical protein HUT06_07010 [Actinomadura sp. NAK00032]